MVDYLRSDVGARTEPLMLMPKSGMSMPTLGAKANCVVLGNGRLPSSCVNVQN
jgi:hypothetical protein